MNPIFDTIVRLANFPAQHGYTMVFVVAFGLPGLVRMMFRGTGRGSTRLQELRAATDGAQAPGPNPTKVVLARIERWCFTALALVVGVGGLIGILSLMDFDVTEGYILDHGVETEGVYDGDAVTFSTDDGTEYRMPIDFFTEAVAPTYTGSIPTDEPITVRYLEQHPQAFVIDSTSFAND